MIAALSFDFSDEHAAFRDQLLAYAETELLPHYPTRAAEDRIPAEVRRQLAALGVLGIGVAEEYGGSGADDPIALGIACEALARGDINVAALPTQAGLTAAQLAFIADPEVRRHYATRVVGGEIEIGIALTEPDSGSDAAALRTVAHPVPGGWRLRGEKASVSHGMTAEAAIVFARAPGSTRHDGVSAFLVDLDADGVTRTPGTDLGMRPIARADLHLDDVFVPASHLCGAEGAGFAQVMRKFDFSRAAIGLMCLGAAQQSLAEAAAYTRERETFGKPIAAYQGVSFPLAEHATYLEGARWICYRALWLRSVDRVHTTEAAMSKWWAPRVAKDAIEAAITTVGHAAYGDALPLQARYRDVFGYLIADGTAQIQKLIIAQDLIGREVRG